MFDKLSASFDELKNGTDYETMKTIIHRYIKNIYISPVEGKLTSFWKKVKIETYNESFNQDKKDQLKENGMEEASLLFQTEFYADVFHHKAYWDLEMKYEVPFVFIDTIPIKRNGRGKKGVNKPIKNHQY